MVATFPTQYPFPVAPGGIRHANSTRPLRGPPSAYTRQPDLGSPPRILVAGGFGSGGGASIANNGSDADQSQGIVAIRCGINPTPSGTIGLLFPAGAAAGQYSFFADWASITQTPPAAGVVTVTWTATRPLLPNESLRLAYQWTVSQ